MAPTLVFLFLTVLIGTSSASHICLEASCSSFIRNFLLQFVTSLTISPLDSQVAIYAYGTTAQTVASLNDGSTLSGLQAKINKTLKYQGSSERNLFQAFSKIQVEVSSSTGLRVADYKKVIVVISGDSWTGNNVIGSPLLTQIQQKFNVVLSVGFGSKALANLNPQLPQLTNAPTNTFFALTVDQLAYVSAWISSYSCPGVQVPTAIPVSTAAPTQSPSVTCSLATLKYDVYLIVDVSNKASDTDFTAMKVAIHDFVAPFTIGDTANSFALVTTGIDSQLFYTAFHNGQSRSDILSAVDGLLQDDEPGQTLNMALNAIQGYLMKPSSASKKNLVYFTSNTNWDVSPTSTMNSLKNKFSLSPLAVQWGSTASSSDLISLVGGSDCVDNVSDKASSPQWLQNKNNFC
uniref:VWFA domain-containing protein n=1 Tax=Caenorhabditis japonica TaxID=281687 RepID=A0A8R1I2X2_CAEJA